MLGTLLSKFAHQLYLDDFQWNTYKTNFVPMSVLLSNVGGSLGLKEKDAE